MASVIPVEKLPTLHRLKELGASSLLIRAYYGNSPVIKRFVPSSLGGRPRTSDTWLLDPVNGLHANILWSLYKHLGRRADLNRNVISAEDLISVYDAYILVAPEPHLDINSAQLAFKLITCCRMKELKCSECSRNFMIHHQRRSSECHYCKIQKERKSECEAA